MAAEGPRRAGAGCWGWGCCMVVVLLLLPTSMENCSCNVKMVRSV